MTREVNEYTNSLNINDLKLAVDSASEEVNVVAAPLLEDIETAIGELSEALSGFHYDIQEDSMALARLNGFDEMLEGLEAGEENIFKKELSKLKGDISEMENACQVFEKEFNRNKTIIDSKMSEPKNILSGEE